MLVARAGALPNSYRFVHVAVDSFENRLLQGRIYHESLEEGIAFWESFRVCGCAGGAL